MSRRWVEEGMNPLPLVVGKQIARLLLFLGGKKEKLTHVPIGWEKGRLPPIPMTRGGQAASWC